MDKTNKIFFISFLIISIIIIVIIALLLHDRETIINNYDNSVKDSLKLYDCDDYKTSFFYDRYNMIKDMYFKNDLDFVIIKHVEEKIRTCEAVQP